MRHNDSRLKFLEKAGLEFYVVTPTSPLCTGYGDLTWVFSLCHYIATPGLGTWPYLSDTIPADLPDSFNVSQKSKKKQPPVSLETQGRYSTDFEGRLSLGKHTFEIFYYSHNSKVIFFPWPASISYFFPFVLQKSKRREWGWQLRVKREVSLLESALGEEKEQNLCYKRNFFLPLPMWDMKRCGGANIHM